MAVLGVTNTFSSGTAIVASQMNTNFDDIEAFVNTTPGVLQLTGGTVTGAVQLNNTLTLGSSGAGHDVILWGDTAGDYFWYDADTNKLVLEGTNGATALDVTDGNVVIGDGTLTVSGEIDGGSLDISGNADIDGTTNLDEVDIDGAVSIDNTVTIGAYGFTIDTDCLYVDPSQNSVGINTTSPVANGFTIGRQPSDVNEGGQLNFEGGTSYSNPMFIDRYQNDLRFLYNGGIVGRWAADGKITAAGGADFGGAVSITGDYDFTFGTVNTQILAAAAGSAASGAVTYSFSGDPDLGWVRVDADTMAGCYGGANRVVLGGTDVWTVRGTVLDQTLVVQSTSQDIIYGVQFEDTDGTAYGYVGGNGNADMSIRALGGSSAMFIMTAGTWRHTINADGDIQPYDQDNAIDFGTSSHRYAQGHFYDVFTHDGSVETSDVTQKTDVTDTPLGLDFLKSLRPVQFRWNDGTRHHQGFIAQEVETVLNAVDGVTASNQGMWCVKEIDNDRLELVDVEYEQEMEMADGTTKVETLTRTDKVIHENPTTYEQGLRYNELMAPLVKAVQELATRLEALEA